MGLIFLVLLLMAALAAVAAVVLSCNMFEANEPIDDTDNVDPGVTVVTALYDIGREARGDGRKFDHYRAWFKQTLALRAPMVVFVDPSLERFVQESRPKGLPPIKIIVEPLALPHLPQIKEIISRNKLNEKSGWFGGWFGGELAFRMPEYLALIHKKFEWVQRAIDLDPFKSKLFAWVDAGQSRFWPKGFEPSKCPWPHPSWIKIMLESDRVWLQGRTSAKTFLGMNEQQREALIGTAESCVWATVFIGSKKSMNKLCTDMGEVLQGEMLGRGRVDTEQVGLQMLWLREPGRFCMITPSHAGNWWGLDQFPELLPILQRPKPAHPPQ